VSSPDTLHVHRLNAGEVGACERIMRGLPEWFGIEAALVAYVQDVEHMETWVAARASALGPPQPAPCTVDREGPPYHYGAESGPGGGVGSAEGGRGRHKPWT
jgi:hypothetical protein